MNDPYLCLCLNTGPAWIHSSKINYSIFIFLSLPFSPPFFSSLLFFSSTFDHRNSLSNLASRSSLYHTTLPQTFFYVLLIRLLFHAHRGWLHSKAQSVYYFFLFFLFFFGFFVSSEPVEIEIVLKSVKRCALNDDRRKQRPSRRLTKIANLPRYLFQPRCLHLQRKVVFRSSNHLPFVFATVYQISQLVPMIVWFSVAFAVRSNTW